VPRIRGEEPWESLAKDKGQTHQRVWVWMGVWAWVWAPKGDRSELGSRVARGWLRDDDGGVDGNEEITCDSHWVTLGLEFQWFVGGRLC
jgi:hypothetical protein